MLLADVLPVVSVASSCPSPRSTLDLAVML